jgi:hypothetical protein
MGATVPHIAVVLHVEGDAELERQVVHWVEACRLQLLEHVAPAWDAWAPPPGVFYYGISQHIPLNQAAVVGIYNDAFNPEAGGYHAAIGKNVIGAVDLSRSAKPSRTLSHEVCEIFRNAFLDEWTPGPEPGRDYAIETSDPCQRHDYEIAVEVLGEHRKVTVGDFVMPRWFDLPSSSPRYTWCMTVGDRFEVAPGGYQIARQGDEILYLPARNDAVALSSISRPMSRTKLISSGVIVQRKEPPP